MPEKKKRLNLYPKDLVQVPVRIPKSLRKDIEEIVVEKHRIPMNAFFTEMAKQGVEHLRKTNPAFSSMFPK